MTAFIETPNTPESPTTVGQSATVGLYAATQLLMFIRNGWMQYDTNKMMCALDMLFSYVRLMHNEEINNTIHDLLADVPDDWRNADQANQFRKTRERLEQLLQAQMPEL